MVERGPEKAGVGGPIPSPGTILLRPKPKIFSWYGLRSNKFYKAIIRMHIVYILKSIKNPRRYYVGLTGDLGRRLKEHNSEKSGYSSRYSPREVETHIIFKNRVIAAKFERYLKEGSGQAFLTKHLI